MTKNTQEDLPIFGLEITDGDNVPFGELYLLDFPECYCVE
jgi:hypothetical protein